MHLDSIFINDTLFTDGVDLMRPIYLELAIHLNFAYLCSKSHYLRLLGLLNVFAGPNFISIIINVRRFLNKVLLFYIISGILVANNVGRSWFLVIIHLVFSLQKENSKIGFSLSSKLILKNYCYWYILWSYI
jgi:hypothetical protein